MDLRSRHLPVSRIPIRYPIELPGAIVGKWGWPNDKLQNPVSEPGPATSASGPEHRGRR